MKRDFHEPDPRWDAFSCPDYESYLNKYLVKGRFHKNVPEEVKEAFITIEYLMAHAYYYYPIYDEAVSKTLRTMEMAIKLKCKQLDIPIVVEKVKDRNGVKQTFNYERTFNDLINAVCAAEAEKNMEGSLHRVRDIRNMGMHPDRNSYMGGIAIPAIYSCISLLNIIFAETNIFVEIKKKLELYQKQVWQLKNSPMIFEHKGQGILIYDFDIVDLITVRGMEIACLCVKPVFEVTDTIIEEKKRTGMLPICIWIKDITISDNLIKGIDANENILFKIQTIDTDKAKMAVERYCEYIASIQMSNTFMVNSQISKSLTMFRYNFYGQLYS